MDNFERDRIINTCGSGHYHGAWLVGWENKKNLSQDSHVCKLGFQLGSSRMQLRSATKSANLISFLTSRNAPPLSIFQLPSPKLNIKIEVFSM
jgi:hypothetical protein